MAGLSGVTGGSHLRISAWLWFYSNRFFVRNGYVAWLLIFAFCIVACLFSSTLYQRKSLTTERDLLAEQIEKAKIAPATKKSNPNQLALADFDKILLEPSDIPQAIQDLLSLAETLKLASKKADYKTLPDSGGRFLRYQVSMPVIGDIAVVEKFISQALSNQNALAVLSIQFQRLRTTTNEVNVKIEWQFFIRVPETSPS